MLNNHNKGSVEVINIEQGFTCVKFYNSSGFVERQIEKVAKGTIQIHFSLRKLNKLILIDDNQTIDIAENSSLFMYNPNYDFPINLDLAPNSKYILLLIAINKFHSFFSQEAQMVQFFDIENKSKKYYTKKGLNPREIVVLNELFNFNLNPSLEALYTKGKVFELLSILFHKGDKHGAGHCPFLKDEHNVKKIIEAKNIIVERMDDPPHLDELALLIQLPINKLKEGFKEIYGLTIFNFLLNYKMELARDMIESKKYNVTEISNSLGYSTPSHFIVAFKTKYGTTPKKYMLNISH